MILSGYMGSGKSSVIRQILTRETGTDFAIIQHEPGFETLIEKIDQKRKIKRKLVQSLHVTQTYSNKDLLVAVDTHTKEADYIIVELNGTSAPFKIAELLNENYIVDAIINVVDAKHFWLDFTSDSLLVDHQAEEQAVMVTNRLTEQIEYSNVLVLNQCNGLSEERLQELEWFLGKLQPHAKVVRTSYGLIGPTELLHTGLFDAKDMRGAVGWMTEILQKRRPLQLVGRYGIGSFVYEKQIPFDSDLFYQWIEELPQEILRTKGVVWLEGEEHPLVLSQSGPSICIDEGQEGEVALFFQVQKDRFTSIIPIKTELVFIGIDLNREEIIQALDSCLVLPVGSPRCDLVDRI